MKKRVLIIGGGASGMAAAIAAADSGADVTVIEHMDRVGKKILSTGNGRCNLTNRQMDPSCYRCDEADFPMKVLKHFLPEDTIAWFHEMGLEVRERQGYYYPASDQASSVLDAHRFRLRELGVNVMCGVEPDGIGITSGGFEVSGKKKDGQAVKFWGNALILAAGSKAAPSTGSDGSGYGLAKDLGHRVIRPLPALVQLRCQGNLYKVMAGVRTEAELTLFASGKKMARDRGELQITDYGLSGIPAFQISRYASRALDEGKKVTVSVDFLPARGKKEVLDWIARGRADFPNRTGEELLGGLINKKLALGLLKLAGIRPSAPAESWSRKQSEALCRQMKEYEALVQSVNPFANAQVCCGGVDTSQVDPETLESRLISGLYLIGELLDVDGICGGYNLQWAWATGNLAGRAAARKKEQNRNFQKEVSR